MRRHISTTLAVLLAASACSGGRHSEWDNIDYSSVYRKAGESENDSGYRAPRIIGCIDEDLYNCGR